MSIQIEAPELLRRWPDSVGDARVPSADVQPRELSYAQAIQEAMAIAMENDERVFLMGEDIGVYGGAFQVTGDLVQRFGTERVMDTPISELGAAGVAVGAALTGLRPILEFQFSDFSALAMEQIVNQAAKLRFMLGGAVSVPLVMRFPSGSGTGAAAQHSQASKPGSRMCRVSRLCSRRRRTTPRAASSPPLPIPTR